MNSMNTVQVNSIYSVYVEYPLTTAKQPFCRFTYDIAHFPTLQLHHLRHSSFSNPPFASPTSQALHLRHLASRP